MAIRLLIVLFCAGLISSVKAADFSGTYEVTEDGVTTTLVLTQDGDKVTGTAKEEGGELDIVGTVKGDVLTGTATLKNPPITLYMTATLSGDSLTVKLSTEKDMSDPDVSVLKRKIGKAPTGPDVKPDKPGMLAKFSKEPTATLKNGKEYTHASGGKLRYPSDWTLKEGEGYLQLVPSDAKEGEIIIVLSESAEGATDPASPEVLAYLDGQVAQSMPDAKRDGKVEKAVAGAGKGAILAWTGTANGAKTFVRAYVTIIKNKGVALVAAGPREVVEARDKALREIFQSIGWGQGKVDAQLVGTWNYWGYKGSTDGKYGREEKATCVLNADGSFSYSNSAETNISADTGSLSSRRGNGWGGTWTADGSTIILNFEDGSSESFNYKFEQQGANVFLVTTNENGKDKREWSRGS